MPPSVHDHIPVVALPPTVPPRAADVPFLHISARADPALAVASARTFTVLLAVVVPHDPPLVVSIRVAVPVQLLAGVHVALSVVAFGVNVPPAAVDQVPPVAVPPTDPPRPTVVLFLHISASAAPALAVGPSTLIVLLAVVVPHEPPLVVSTSVAVPVQLRSGVQVAFSVVALGVNVPPADVDHVPPVALPPTDPPSAADAVFLHISARAEPAFAVGLAFTVNVLLAVEPSQVPPCAVSTSVVVPVQFRGGVHVALRSVAEGEKVPPSEVDQVPLVASPPIDPPRGADVPFWQIAVRAEPAFTHCALSFPANRESAIMNKIDTFFIILKFS